MEDSKDFDVTENFETVEEYYGSLKLLVETMEEDALKNSKGNKAAGVRLRKSLRHLKKFTGDFVKFTLEK
jgi:hypothetical protein